MLIHSAGSNAVHSTHCALEKTIIESVSRVFSAKLGVKLANQTSHVLANSASKARERLMCCAREQVFLLRTLEAFASVSSVVGS